MFKTPILATYIVASFAGAFTSFAVSAKAEDLEEMANDFAGGCGIGMHRDANGRCVWN